MVQTFTSTGYFMHALNFGGVVLGWIAFVASMLFSGGSAPPDAGAPKVRATRSLIGIALQGLAFAVAWSGFISFRTDAPRLSDIAVTTVTLALALAASALFIWSRRTMGRSWSLVAQTGDALRLATDGPFAHVRHPIYVALFLMLLATAIGLHHLRNLAIAVPLYALGTMQRVAIEERLLRTRFSEAYDAYARRVRRFVPGLF